MSIVFIGGGNMATALIGGLLRAGHAPQEFAVVEPDSAKREQLAHDRGVRTYEQAEAALAGARAVVLAVKPQQMQEACAAARGHLGRAVVVSIAAGTRATDIARWLDHSAVVRAMPNTPALIGMGMTGLAALPAVGKEQRQLAESILRGAGDVIWFDNEAMLDAVTAVSGSGPAYVFYFLEALERAGSEMGLAAGEARRLAVTTFAGAAELAARSTESLATLRERVTSKGGTTAAALAQLESAGVAAALVRAAHAAQSRASEMADEFGRP